MAESETPKKPSFLGNVMRKTTEIISFGSVFTAAATLIAGVAATFFPEVIAGVHPEAITAGEVAAASFTTAGLAAIVGGSAVVANTALSASVGSENPKVAQQAERLHALEKIHSPSPTLAIEEELVPEENIKSFSDRVTKEKECNSCSQAR